MLREADCASRRFCALNRLREKKRKRFVLRRGERDCLPAPVLARLFERDCIRQSFDLRRVRKARSSQGNRQEVCAAIHERSRFLHFEISTAHDNFAFRHRSSFGQGKAHNRKIATTCKQAQIPRRASANSGRTSSASRRQNLSANSSYIG